MYYEAAIISNGYIRECRRTQLQFHLSCSRIRLSFLRVVLPGFYARSGWYCLVVQNRNCRCTLSKRRKSAVHHDKAATLSRDRGSFRPVWTNAASGFPLVLLLPTLDNFDTGILGGSYSRTVDKQPFDSLPQETLGNSE